MVGYPNFPEFAVSGHWHYPEFVTAASLTLMGRRGSPWPGGSAGIRDLAATRENLPGSDHCRILLGDAVPHSATSG
jgi:hypothetical protein